MSISLDKLPEDEIDKVRDSMFVRALFSEIHTKAAQSSRAALDAAATGSMNGRICALAGEARAYREVLHMIETAGKESDS